MYERIKAALRTLNTDREMLRSAIERARVIKPLKAQAGVRWSKTLEIRENRLASLNALIDFVEDQLKVLEARGEASYAPGYAGTVLTAEQRADVAVAERECISILDWYARRHAAGNMPEPHFTSGTKGVKAVRRCLDLLVQLPVAAPLTKAQKLFEAHQRILEQGHRCTPRVWSDLSMKERAHWELTVRALEE